MLSLNDDDLICILNFCDLASLCTMCFVNRRLSFLVQYSQHKRLSLLFLSTSTFRPPCLATFSHLKFQSLIYLALTKSSLCHKPRSYLKHILPMTSGNCPADEECILVYGSSRSDKIWNKCTDGEYDRFYVCFKHKKILNPFRYKSLDLRLNHLWRFFNHHVECYFTNYEDEQSLSRF